MLPPRPAWPADETMTDCALVGSKLGAGALPGVRNASSRKLRPLSGSDSISRAETTEPTTEPRTLTVPASPATVTCSLHRRHLQIDLDLGRLADFELDARDPALGKSRRRHDQIDVARRNVGQREVAGGVGLRLALKSGARLVDDAHLGRHPALLRVEHAARGAWRRRRGCAQRRRRSASRTHGERSQSRGKQRRTQELAMHVGADCTGRETGAAIVQNH